MDQRGLIERARRGEHDAFTALLDVHLARLDAAARLILRDPDLARDTVPEALVPIDGSATRFVDVTPADAPTWQRRSD